MGIDYISLCHVMETKYEPPFDLIVNRIVASLLNGIIYASPFGFFKEFRELDRIDIYVNHKDKTTCVSRIICILKKITIL